jgi:hypothetical protein
MGFLGQDIGAGDQGGADRWVEASAIASRTEPPVMPSMSTEADGSSERAAQVRCPQDQDCPAGGLATRVFDCDQGCGFRGCAACMAIHESEPHAGDSATTLEMVRNIGGSS